MVYIDDDALVIKFPDLHPNAGVRIDLQKEYSLVLKKYRDGESDLIRNIYFTQFVVQ